MLKTKRIEDRKLLDTYHAAACEACGRVGCDPAHIKSKGSGGDDVDWNLIPLCRNHHTEQHKIGWTQFSEKHIAVAYALAIRGWEFRQGKLRRD